MNAAPLPQDYRDLDVDQKQHYVSSLQTEVADLQAALDELRRSAPQQVLSRHAASLVPYPPMVKFKPAKALRSAALKHRVLQMCAFKQVGGHASLATVTQGGTAVLWDAGSGLKYEAFHIGKGSTMSLGANTNGTVLAAGGLSCFIEIYVIGTQLRELTQSQVNVKVALRDIDAGKSSISGRAPQYRFSLAGHDAAVTAVQFLDETAVVSGAQDSRVIVWDVTSAKPTMSLHEAAPVTAVDTARGMLFASATQDGVLKVWDARDSSSHAEKFRAPAPLVSARFMPDEQSVLAATRGGLHLFDLRCNATLESYEFNGGAVSAVDVSSSGRLAVIGTESGALIPLDLLQNRWFPAIQKRKDRVSGVCVADGVVYSSSWDGSVRAFYYQQ